MRGRVLASVALVLAFSCAGASNVPTPNCTVPPSRVRFGGPELHVQLATNDAAREHGLMGVTDLPPDEGMAFTWDAATGTSFWMKDTLIPLAIAFVDADGRIVTISEMTPCAADPCPTYAAAAPYTMAVEANAGWYTDHAITVGDPARLIEGFCS